MNKGNITVLGLGAMGSAITERLRDTGHTTTVWNRTVAKTEPRVKAGSAAAATVAEAVAAGDIVFVVLLDHAAVHEHLAPIAVELKDKVVVNLTTTTPNEARATATWAAEHGVAYLDGAILAVPDMIGGPEALIFYSGGENAYTLALPALEPLGTARFEGDDPGIASLKDMALLSSMYLMLNGYLQAAAMMRTVGVSAVDTAADVMGWLSIILNSLPHFGTIIDDGVYDPAAGQDVDFTRAALSSLITASREQGVGADFLEPGKALLDELAVTGRGTGDWPRIIELLTIK